MIPTTAETAKWNDTELYENAADSTDGGGDVTRNLFPVREHIRDLYNEVRGLRVEMAAVQPGMCPDAVLGRRLRGSYLSLGCSADTAVAYIGVCHDAAEEIARMGDDFNADSHLERVQEWLRDNGYGESEYTVTFSLDVAVVASDRDAAQEAALERIRWDLSPRVDSRYGRTHGHNGGVADILKALIRILEKLAKETGPKRRR